MNIYDAIMKAADHIESNPREFDFYCIGVPENLCDSPGCAIGWINYFTGTSRGYRLAEHPEYYLSRNSAGRMSFDSDVCLGVDQTAVYTRLDALYEGWRSSAGACAAALRLYANNYHAPAKPVTPPDWNALASKWTVGDDVRSQELVS